MHFKGASSKLHFRYLFLHLEPWLEPIQVFCFKMTEFYIKHNKNAVGIDTAFGRGPNKDLPLATVGHLIAACATEPTQGLLGLPPNTPLTLHLPEGADDPPVPDNQMDDRVNADGSLRPGLLLSELGLVGTDDRTPLIIKDNTGKLLFVCILLPRPTLNTNVSQQNHQIRSGRSPAT
jgi:hypothetical protein